MSEKNHDALQAALEAAQASDDSFVNRIFSFARKVSNSRSALSVKEIETAAISVSASLERLGYAGIVYNGSQCSFVLPNGSEVMLIKAHTESDLVRNGGHEWQLIAVNGIDDMPGRHLQFLRARLRARGEVRSTMELHELPLQVIGRNRNGEWQVVQDEPIVIPHAHQYLLGSSKCVGCGAPIVYEGPRPSQISALNNLIVDGTGALTAEELEALPNDSVVLTVGPVGQHSWVLSKKENGLLQPFEEFIDDMSIAEMVGYKTFLLQRGES